MEYTNCRASEIHITTRYEQPRCTMSKAEFYAAEQAKYQAMWAKTQAQTVEQRQADWEKFDKAAARNNSRIAADARQLEISLAPTAPRGKMVNCECGHNVAANLVMSASKGTSCPDCYDRMSD